MFVDAASSIAKRFKLPELLIGATVVSIGTTLPEVMVSATAAANGNGAIAYGNAIAEWNVQAASFASYVTGMLAEEVAGIAIDETTKPADGTDLAATVTISIAGFQALIAKALG